jgi:hypothetical protein
MSPMRLKAGTDLGVQQQRPGRHALVVARDQSGQDCKDAVKLSRRPILAAAEQLAQFGNDVGEQADALLGRLMQQLPNCGCHICKSARISCCSYCIHGD